MRLTSQLDAYSERLIGLPSWRIALIAVVIFAIFEALLKGFFLPYYSIAIYLIVRLIVAFLTVRFLAERIFGSPFRPHLPSISPLRIHPVHWMRGLFWLASILCLAVTLALSPNQAFAYAFFFLHPLWTIWAGNWFVEEWIVDAAGNKVTAPNSMFRPLLVTATSAILFAIAPHILTAYFAVKPLPVEQLQAVCTLLPAQLSGTETQGGGSFWLCVFATLAGIFFALANTLAATAKKLLPIALQSRPFVAASTTTFYSSYTSLMIVGSVLISNIWVRSDNISCIDSSSPLTYLSVAILAVASIFVTFASILFAKAFVRRDDQPVSATIDLGIAPIALIIDLITRQSAFSEFGHPIRQVQLLALVMIIAGAVWTIRRDHDNRLYLDSLRSGGFAKMLLKDAE